MSRPARTVRTAAGRARSVAGRARRGLGRLRRDPRLSAVVVVTDDNARFAEACVRSLLTPERPADEVVLVVTGEPGREADAAAAALAAGAPDAPGGATVLREPLPGAGTTAALVAGAALATGELLVLLDAGEELRPGTLAELAGALAEDRAAELAGAGRGDLGRARIGDLVLRADLWRRALPAPEEHEDAPHHAWWLPARLVLGAARLAEVGHRPRTGERRGTGVAFGTMPVRAPYVEAWTAAVADVRAHLAGEDLRGFLRYVLAEDAVPCLDDAERCTPRQWDALVAAVHDLLDAAPADLVADLPVEARVRLHLAAAGRRADLEQYAAARWLEEGQFPTVVRDGAVVADLPVPGPPLPDGALTLGPSETPLRLSLRGLRWLTPGDDEADGDVDDADDADLALDLYAWVPRLGWDAGGPDEPAEHRVVAVLPDGTERDLPVEVAPDPDVNRVSQDRFADHAAGSLTAVLAGAGRLLRDARDGDVVEVRVTSFVAGVRRSATLAEADLRSSAAGLPAPAGSPLTLRPRRAGAASTGLVVTAPPAPPAGPQVTEVTLERDVLVVRGCTPAPDQPGGEPLWLALRGAAAAPAVRADLTPRAEGRGGAFEARLPLAHDPWGLGARPLPPGVYRVHRVDPDHPDAPGTPGAPGTPDADGPRVPIAPALAARTPQVQRTDRHRLTVQRGLDGALLLTLAAPLAEDETGPLAQQRLQRAYLTTEHRVDPGTVYLQSYTGQVATDSPLAIHHELRRQRPDLRLRWAVADSSTVVPEGGEGVLLRSRAWYDALATSGHLVTNIDLDRWFTKQPGQRVLQTYHGHPAKTMGIAAWAAKNFTPLRIERQLRRTSGTWDALVTPSPAMDEHYRREYRYDGPILAAGYPRDDALVGPDAGRVREQTRARLGLADRTAVLYAPTWRDDLATNFRAADLVTAFDVEAAAEALGEDYVILLRGHRFHRRRDAAGSRLLDVTGYPEINDLVLAADAAVLDYSSLRFDVALTGRPMVFLVPDLHRYTGGVRGFLFDFAASAPGPLVDTTAEVVEALRDLDALAAAYAEETDRFAATYSALQDGHAAERVVAAFFGPPPDRPDDGSRDGRETR